MGDEDAARRRYEARWCGYHTVLCLGVWVIALCCLYAIFNGWGNG